MTLRFCVLGSSSSGNASYLEADGFGVLLDVGLGPRRVAKGLAAAGAGWERVRAAMLTHTHSDHWTRNTLKQLLRRGITLYCHRQHAETLRRHSMRFQALEAANLVRAYEAFAPIELGPFQCVPFPVSHDDEPTCGFRIEGAAGTVSYATDLGSWSQSVARHLCEADIVAVEFNHDVAMERASGRPRMLIERVLGDRGHLSNDQAARLLAHVLRNTEPGRTRHVVLLHLSRECNDPRLAHAAAAAALRRHGQGAEIHVARHNAPSAVLTTGRRPGARCRLASMVQPWLPGWND
ncbi:MAG: MBL fold metallo-hydrolase [Gemmataceae bacterium]|nr:MBL fold metallo-hydrolase [Gemmataceae bacterium]